LVEGEGGDPGASARHRHPQGGPGSNGGGTFPVSCGRVPHPNGAEGIGPAAQTKGGGWSPGFKTQQPNKGGGGGGGPAWELDLILFSRKNARNRDSQQGRKGAWARGPNGRGRTRKGAFRGHRGDQRGDCGIWNSKGLTPRETWNGCEPGVVGYGAGVKGHGAPPGPAGRSASKTRAWGPCC